MTHIEQAIRDAESAGYEKKTGSGKLFAEMCALLDPAFWQALGRARGWEGTKYICDDCYLGDTGKCTMQIPTWKFYWHRFIDHLAEGKDAESFFKDI